MVATVIMKLSWDMGSDSRIMPLNLSDGSTL